MIAESHSRFWLFSAAGAIVAVLAGVQLAEGNVIPAAVALALPALVVMERWIPIGAVGMLLGGLLIGNVIGNRGFAQLAPLAPLPLFPAELGLAAGAVWLLVRGAGAGRLPFRADPLGFSVLAWVVLSSLRLPFDVRDHGVVALRDYALVYYAFFFFVAREAARDDGVRTGLHRLWVLAVLALALVYPFYERFEGFFLTSLAIGGIPVIAIKNDLAGTFAAACAMYAAVRWAGTRRLAWGLILIVTLGLALYLVTRAGFVGMACAALFFMPGARVKVAQALGVLLMLGALAGALQTTRDGYSWRETRLYDVYEHVVSLTDFSGSRAYEGMESQDTGDNTQFRLVWWRLLVERTLFQHPFAGAGFGADISSEFARDYLGAGAGDFTARSPHNVLLTIFARSGFAGLVPFLAFVAVFLRELWRRRSRQITSLGYKDDVRDAAMGCAALVIFVSACFGVVLEGPMGAVVFWILLGTTAARFGGADDGDNRLLQAIPDNPSSALAQDKPWHNPSERPNRTHPSDPS